MVAGETLLSLDEKVPHEFGRLQIRAAGKATT
jgi:hypothetical protein